MMAAMDVEDNCVESTIYADETGNSGENLLDPEQPVFVLASNDFSSSEAAHLLGHVVTQRRAEVKFSSLKKTASGLVRLEKLLSDPLLSKDRVVVNWVLKPYMVVTKIVDLVFETLYHNAGGDLYENAAHVKLANMLHYLPLFCGEEQTDRFLSSFVRMVWKRTASDVANYFRSAEQIALACSNYDLRQHLLTIGDRNRFFEWFEHVSTNALDPAIPSVALHMDQWSRRKHDRFDVVHDESKPVAAWKDYFALMMAADDQQPQAASYGDHQFLFPFRAKSLTQGKSTDHPQLQIADICAGALSHWLRCTYEGKKDPLASIVENIGCSKWVVGSLGPSTDVTPAELNTTGTHGRNPIDPIAKQFAERTKGDGE
jgi:hypothetical protein